jgi:hypothetical protein
LGYIARALVVHNEKIVAVPNNLAQKTRATAGPRCDSLKARPRHLLITVEAICKLARWRRAIVGAISKEGEVKASGKAFVTSLSDIVHPHHGARFSIADLLKTRDSFVEVISKESDGTFLALQREIRVCQVNG